MSRLVQPTIFPSLSLTGTSKREDFEENAQKDRFSQTRSSLTGGQKDRFPDQTRERTMEADKNRRGGGAGRVDSVVIHFVLRLGKSLAVRWLQGDNGVSHQLDDGGGYLTDDMCMSCSVGILAVRRPWRVADNGAVGGPSGSKPFSDRCCAKTSNLSKQASTRRRK